MRSKINFANMLKIVRKSGKLPDFRTIFNIFAKLIFALKLIIWVLTHPNKMHKNFHKVFIQGSYWGMGGGIGIQFTTKVGCVSNMQEMCIIRGKCLFSALSREAFIRKKNYETYNRSERKQVFASNSKFQIKRFR